MVDANSAMQRYFDRVPVLAKGGSVLKSSLKTTFWVVVSAGIAFAAITMWGLTSSYESREVTLKGGIHLTGLWDMGTGRIGGARQDEWEVTVFTWSLNTGDTLSRIDVQLDELMPGSVIKKLRMEKESPEILSKRQKNPNAPRNDVQDNGSRRYPIWVGVSKDISTLVWIWEDWLYQAGIYNNVITLRRRFKLPAVYYNLFGILPSGNVLLYRGRQVFLLHANDTSSIGGSSRPEMVQVLIDGCEPSTWRGKHLLSVCKSGVVVSGISERQKGGNLTVATPTIFRSEKDFSTGVNRFALSSKGDPVVATDRGTLLFWSSVADSEATSEVQSPGIVDAIAFERGVAAVGGGFRGIFLLKPDGSSFEIVKGVTGTTHVEILSERDALVYSTPDGAGVAFYKESRSVNRVGWTVVAAWGGLWLVVLFVVSSGRRLLKNRDQKADDHVHPEMERHRKRPMVSSEQETEIPRPDPPSELIEACVSGECVGFVGAGMGAQAGFPTWRPLIQSLLDEVGRKDLLPVDELRSLGSAFSEDQIDLVADGIVSGLKGNKKVLYDFLRGVFLKKVQLPPRYDLLRSLRLSAVLTTNFDTLLEETFPEHRQSTYTQLDAEQLLAATARKEFFLLNLYGSLNRPDSVLLAPFQYYEAMARNPLFSRFMETLFNTRTLFFLGASLEGIEAYLSGIKFPTSMPQRHFALVATTGGAWRAKAGLLLRRFGIQVIPFKPTDGFPEVEEFLRKLAKAIQAREEVPTQSKGTSYLQHVEIENIGAFDHLELDLDPNWNILLGDNGVGKSTILKAIAVGIVGQNAADFAGRLIKVGKKDATIILTTNTGKRYVTEIQRGDGRTLVETRPALPIDAEGWVVLGFPPLRTFTWSTSAPSSTKGLERISSEDLLPLIRGETDPRLDKLKDWIIQLENIGMRETLATVRSAPNGHDGKPYSDVRERYFHLVSRVTPGVKIEFDRIDPYKNEVYVRTDDGIVRIESVSQGTQSLLGWVGILLQRMADFYGGLDDKTAGVSNKGQYALVLIDEIDAHMHPLWQRIIVHELSKLLPKVQFVASTHSPLIVGGMKPAQVVRLVRNGGVKKVPLTEQVLLGRADQLLTSRLFGLDSTLDVKTEEEVVPEYKALREKNSLTKEEEKRLQELRREIDVRIPVSGNASIESRAKELLEAVMLQQFGNEFPEAKRKAVAAATEIIAEVQASKARPL